MNETIDNTYLHKSGHWDLIWNIKDPQNKKISCAMCLGVVLPLEHGLVVEVFLSNQMCNLWK